MRVFCLLLVIFSLAVVSSHRSSNAQDKAGELATKMLKEHNEWREKYKVPALAWDETLATDAQNFANQVVSKGVFPPKHRSTSINGENFFWGTAGAFGPKDAVARWESESKNYDRGTNTCAPGKYCVHFTQLVWSTTNKVGCGKATTANRETDFFVCVYYPAGNQEGLGPFSVVSAVPSKTKPATQPAVPTATPKTSTRPAARRMK